MIFAMLCVRKAVHPYPQRRRRIGLFHFQILANLLLVAGIVGIEEDRSVRERFFFGEDSAAGSVWLLFVGLFGIDFLLGTTGRSKSAE